MVVNNSAGIADIRNSAAAIYSFMAPTPQINWPLLSQRLGCKMWLKHENYNLTGSFKVRGGLIYLSRLRQRAPATMGVIAATRGNYGQSVAYAAQQFGMQAVVVVPEGNSTDKNNAMLALGAELIIAGKDFDESIEIAQALAVSRGLHLMPSFHLDLVAGISSYALELFSAVPNLKRVYVPIGLGSGICSVINVRNALGLDCEVVGVVSEQAAAYALSFVAGHVVGTNSADTMADGLAVRNPNLEALEIILANAARIVTVSDAEIKSAINILFNDTHNVAEGAGAAAVAAAIKEAKLNVNEPIAAVLTGGNINKSLFIAALE